MVLKIGQNKGVTPTQSNGGAVTPESRTQQARSSALPRSWQDGSENPDAKKPGLFAQYKKPVMAIVGGAMALPMVASVAHATEASTAAPDTEDMPETPLADAPEAAPTETFDNEKLTEYSLFKKFWDSGIATDGTAHSGLDEVTPKGVTTLVDFAKAHDLDGSVSKDGEQVVSKAERDLIKNVLEHPTYGTFFELDALPKLYTGFDIPAESVHSVAEATAAARSTLAKAMGRSTDSMKLSFPDAGPSAETTYFAMDGAMATPMSHVDAYREALGLKTGAEAYEKAPVLGWMMGVDKGHTKYGSFSEKSPFSTSGLNWGTLLFPGNKDVEKLPVQDGFEFAIDALTGFNRAVGGFASRGDTIAPVDKDGNKLTAEVVIHKDDAGKAESWSAVFKNADGEVVNAADVTGLIKDRYGNTKGDGKVDGSMNMGWWGFCDRNTAERLYKSKFNIPQLDRDVRVEVNGKIITIPQADAQKLLDVDVTDIVGRASFAGARFDDEPSTIRMLDGSSVTGKVKGFNLHMGPSATRGYGDNITIRNSDANPLLGSIELKSSYGSNTVIDLSTVESITKNAEGEVEVKISGSSYTRTGELLTELDFSGATTADDGSQVLTNSKSNPIKGGEVVVDIGGGATKRVKAEQVKTIAGEMRNEMRVTDYLDFIMKNDGMFATDNSTGVIVSNGMRWINKLSVTMHESADTPEWAKGKTLMGVTKGELTRQEGDKLMLVDGLYKTEYSDALHSNFKGWVQLDSSGDIIDQGFISGEPDFGWAASGPIDWNAKSSFNPHMVPEMRLKMLVNGVADEAKLESMAEKLNFPSNWKSLRLPAAE